MNPNKAQGSRQFASDFDLSETCRNPTEHYGLPSKWDFRPPHPIEAGTVITEMELERGPSEAVGQ